MHLQLKVIRKLWIVCACSVVSHSLRPHGPGRLFCPWSFPGKNSGVGCPFLLPGLFATQGLNPSLLYLLRWQVDFFLPLSHLGSPNSQIIFAFLLLKMYKFSKVYTIGGFPLKSVFLVNEFYLQIHWIIE